jgi:RpiB/LacA/LacB family sugar-phosphate isomerase
MKILIASDHGGYRLKETIKEILVKKGFDVADAGCESEESVHYPVFAADVAENVASGKYDRGILVCGSGIGMSIVANRVKGVRAALCFDPLTAQLSREHNDSNILCLGGRIIGPKIAEEIVFKWLGTPFLGGRHEERIKMIDAEAK